MMTIARGGELRQLLLLGIQIGVLTGLLLKFVSFLHSFYHWMGGVRVLSSLSSSVVFFLTDNKCTVSSPAGLLPRWQPSQEETTVA